MTRTEVSDLLRKAEENCERAERVLAAPLFTQRSKPRLIVDNEPKT